MEMLDTVGELPSFCSGRENSTPSLRSIVTSVCSSAGSQPAAASYPSCLKPETKAPQPGADLQSLLDIFRKTAVPGPKLIRLQREFYTPLGHGGQGNVYGVSAAFAESALALQDEDVELKAKHSALYWTKCVVKHLRTDQGRNAVQHAYREINQLCHPSLRHHPNIVKLVSWGLSLDHLESQTLGSLTTPLLVLERAFCDLARFIGTEEYDSATYESLCHICLDVGQGLGAVHSAGIIHGDLKLENILIIPKENNSETGWTAKLCDFGSAVSIAARSNEVPKYLGSDTWRPPECYEKYLLGTPMPEPLIPCDIFVYGLVVWATFVGVPFSPLYKMQSVEGHGAEIVRNIGRQNFYARASKSITAKYSMESSNVHRLVAELTEQTFSQFGGAGERRKVERRQKAHSWGSDRFWFQDKDIPKKLETRFRRILLVLRGSLNDSPHRRDRHTWRYLDCERFPIISHVDDPETFEPEHGSNRVADDVAVESGSLSQDLLKRILPTLPLVTMDKRINRALEQGRHWRQRCLVRCREFQEIFSAHIGSKLCFLLLRKHERSPRERVYRDCLKAAATQITHIETLGPFDYLEHCTGGKHCDVDKLITTSLQYFNSRLCNNGMIRTVERNDHILYASARLLSHIKLCCWSACSHDSRGDIWTPLAWSANDIVDYLNSPACELSVLVWLCRGEVGQYELRNLKESSSLLSRLWSFLFTGIECTHEKRTNVFLLLMENGFDIHQIVQHQHVSKSAFLWYLYSLDDSEKALDVAVHFQRIAEHDDCPPENKFYLVGRTSDISIVDSHNESPFPTMTTALHDAVEAHNYPLVQYLVGTHFNTLARDCDGRLALDLAMEGEKSSSASSSITSLLQRTMRGRNQCPKDQVSDLPLGWTHICTSEKRPTRVWQETSIEGDFDAVTFMAPSTGLHEAARVTLGRSEGQGPVYQFDPTRFLKVPMDVPSKYRPATKAVFGDDWYKKDIQAVEA
ncbi:MAG: hypothetical protein Q9181_006478 [Wetmoreana brouardii]